MNESRIILNGESIIGGEITLPTSKSLSNRALIIASLAQNPILPDKIAICDDTFVMQQALRSSDPTIDIGAAGTAMRFLTAYLSITQGERIITGTKRMKERPIGPLVDALRAIGAEIEYIENEGFPPLKIKGNPMLQGGEITLRANISSQYISALLMIAPLMQKGLSITLEGKIISAPYIGMTLSLMEHYGVKSVWKENTICVPHNKYTGRELTIESDWSAASYAYQIAALSKKRIVLDGLSADTWQADGVVKEIFTTLGIQTIFDKGQTLLQPIPLPYRSYFEYNFTNCPDIAQTVVVTTLLLGIPFRFSGLESLAIKETDRIAALINECKKIGFILTHPQKGVLLWDGSTLSVTSIPPIATYHDHRMAMAFAPVSIVHKGITILSPEVVSKSFPAYFEQLQKVGIQIQSPL